MNRSVIQSPVRSRSLLGMAFCLAIGACRAQVPKTCLSQVYTKGAPGTQTVFDDLNDHTNVNHASFSCDLTLSASSVRDVLESFRAGVIDHDPAKLNRAMKYPVTVILGSQATHARESATLRISNSREWFAFQKARMTKKQIAEIGRSSLSNIEIEGTSSFNPGFIIGNGLVFFRVLGTNRAAVKLIDLGDSGE